MILKEGTLRLHIVLAPTSLCNSDDTLWLQPLGG